MTTRRLDVQGSVHLVSLGEVRSNALLSLT